MGLRQWVPTPSQTLEGHGPGYVILPGGTATVSTTAIGFEPSK